MNLAVCWSDTDVAVAPQSPLVLSEKLARAGNGNPNEANN